MSGHVGDLSPKQQKALEEFQKRVSDLDVPRDDDGYYLLRWLRARDFDVQKSETMLRKHMIWREYLDIENLHKWKSPEVLDKYFTGGWCGYDKDGCPIWLDPFGQVDIKGILRSASKGEMERNKVQLLELAFNVYCKEQSLKRNERVDKILVMYDMESLGWQHLWKPGVDLFIELIHMFEDHYPETLKYTIIVNAPKIFPIAFNLIKPFMSDVTANKTIIFGKDFKEGLQKYIDPDQLPVHYGGTMTDPDGDPRCSSKVHQGGMVPKEYYRNTDFKELANLKQATISSRSSLIIDCEITSPNSGIRWQFSTMDNDLGFGIYKKTSKTPKTGKQKVSDMEVIVPTKRVNCHMVPEDGSLPIKTPGSYVVHFDNTYSWMTSKKIYYNVEVLTPDTEDDFPTSSTTASITPSPSDSQASADGNKEEEVKLDD